MNKIRLITDAASDILKNEFKDIEVVDFYIYDATDNKELEVQSADELYREMEENPDKHFKTACPTIDTYYQLFKKNAEDGFATICVCITSKFSGSYNSAVMAKKELMETHPDAKIIVVDSAANACMQGLLVLSIYEMIQSGLSYEEILEKIKKLVPTGKIMFTVDNIEYMRKGGRIGKVSAFVAGALNLKPIIVMKEGDIGLGGIAFGTKRVIAKVLDLVKSHFNKSGEKVEDYNFIVGYSSDKEAGKAFHKLVSETFKIDINELAFRQITACSAVHTGPKTMGVGIMKKHTLL